VLRNSRLRAEIEQRATRDALTGLPNRRVLAGAVEREIARARRTGEPLGLVMLVLDHFKLINDDFGHAVGDRVLREVGRGLLEASRGEDLVARYGGEEFVVLLPNVDASALGQAADRIRKLAGDAAVTRPVTLSAGAACFPFDATDEGALFEAADLALYRAKRAGRDQTQVSAVARNRLRRSARRPVGA
jgi:diguanylate cyclase (GGDEF)-like protein